MNFLEKIIVKTSDRIRAKEAKIKEVKQREDSKRHDIRSTSIKNIRTAINKKLDEVEKEMLKEPTTIKVGDTAIINKFYINYHKAENCWDWGPQQLRKCIDKEEYLRPCRVEITKLQIHRLYADECIDGFINNLEDKGRLAYYGDNPDGIMTPYLLYIKAKNHKWINEYGLYKEFLFKPINFTFAPSWGLNIYSFLKLDSKAGRLTEMLWDEESKWTKSRSDAVLGEKEFEEKKTRLIKQYEENHF